jgi:hypothetical protein
MEVIKCSLSKGVESKMRERKLRSGVKWQGSLKTKGVKQDLGTILKSRSILVMNH